MKRLVIPFGSLLAVALIALSGWAGYASVSWSGASWPIASLPLSAASPTPSVQTRTATVTRGDVR
ncbi:MAG: hypothetical protein M1570_04115 [Chloroflexi bacterium]|nr:hypothetical protein [Chloroflexota bacterium]